MTKLTLSPTDAQTFLTAALQSKRALRMVFGESTVRMLTAGQVLVWPSAALEDEAYDHLSDFAKAYGLAYDQPAPAVGAGGVPSELMGIVEKLVTAEVYKTRTHEKYMGQAMPEDVYERFVKLREETVPALRRELVAALAAAPPLPAAPVWDGKLSGQLQRRLNALRLECPPAIVADIEHHVRLECESLQTSLATNKRMYAAARDALEKMQAEHPQPDPFAAPLPAAPEQTSFQSRVHPWLLECFGAQIAADRVERNHRFLEESLELVQALGCTQSEAHQLVDYVFERPIGEPAQEVGGVMVTLAALCLASDLDMHAAGEVELARIWTKVEKIRAKQAAKPRHSPLPAAKGQEPADALTNAARDVLAERQRQISVEGWTPEHDDEHTDGSLSIAAACYALVDVNRARPGALSPYFLWKFTGWAASWWKPKDRRSNLVRAGALIVAEVERIDRAALASQQPTEQGG